MQEAAHVPNPERDAITCAVIEDPVLYQSKYYERHTFEEWFTRLNGTVPEPEEIPAEERERIMREREAHSELALDAQNGLDLIIPPSLKTLIQKKLIGPEYDAPVVIVVGKESDGKSLTLSRLIVRPIFPFRDNICTLMPVKVKLKTQAKASIPKVYAVEIQPDGTRTPVSTTVHNYTGTNHGKPAPIMEDYVPLEFLQEAIEERMIFLVDSEYPQKQQPEEPEGPGFLGKHRSGVLGKHRSSMLAKKSESQPKQHRRPVSMRYEVVVELSGPHFPNMTLVDLPGVVATDTANANLPRQTRELAQRYLRAHAENSFVCAVMSVQSSMAANDALAVIRECNMLSSSIGVLSKTDLCYPQAVHEARFGKLPVDLGYGLCCVANCVLNGERLEMKTFTELNHREEAQLNKLREAKDVFKQQEKIRAMEECFGIDRVQRKLRDSFETYLCEVWARRTQQALRRSLQDFERGLDRLGYPFVRFEEEDQVIARREALHQHEPDLGASERGQTTSEVARAVLDHVSKTLPTFRVDQLLCTELHKRIVRLFRRVNRAMAAIARERPVAATGVHTLRHTLQAHWARIKAAFEAFAQSLRTTPLSSVLVEAAVAHLRSVESEVKISRFSSLITAIREQLTMQLDTHVDQNINAIVDAFMQDRLKDVEQMLRLKLVPAGIAHAPRAHGAVPVAALREAAPAAPAATAVGIDDDDNDDDEEEQQQQQQEEQEEGSASADDNEEEEEDGAELLWGVRVVVDGQTLVSDLGTKLTAVGEEVQQVLRDATFEEGVVVEDEEVTQCRINTFRDIGDVCEVLSEIHVALGDYEQRCSEARARAANASPAANETSAIEGDLDLPHDDNRTKLLAMRDRIQQRRQQQQRADADPGDGGTHDEDEMVDEVTIATNSADTLRRALAICRQANCVRHLTLETCVLADVLREFGRLFPEMRRLRSLRLKQCDLSDKNVQDTLHLGLQRNTTMNTFTVQDCGLGGPSSKLLRNIVSVNTTLDEIIIKMPSSEAGEYAAVKAALHDNDVSALVRALCTTEEVAQGVLTKYVDAGSQWEAVSGDVRGCAKWGERLTQEQREAVMAAGRQRVPIDRQKRKAWRVDHRICFPA
ncbi:hypothetical protein PTSG_04477 [Salpingoeca rosetta]|uniref:Dynamin N-terminal domain-containing protein n=1 Tax=Salpingoeca rosetta (strain ATCC 50818 / BSB-021) TaxID=946362 RepID=F2U8N9_SALR5|nr:uncharacterized protein PTSG_04477 [Salpingoeca rosetta]EGD72747.1 hypothetical protein PTSG_04477 [Salpingoeca rosetta]|eukprot:XP_004994570.1 hypothetical protein PTSG_04477 [Salpingoeca rosetta]